MTGRVIVWPGGMVWGSDRENLKIFAVCFSEFVSSSVRLVKLIFTIVNSSYEAGKDCLEIEKIGLETLYSNLTVKEQNGNLIAFEEGGGMIQFGWNPSKKIVKIVSLNNSLTTSAGVFDDCLNAKVESTTREKYIFDKEIIKMIDYYQTDYRSFKDFLGIPPGNEFSFSFEYSNGSVINSGQKNVSISVRAEQEFFTYMDAKGDLGLGSFTVEAWR